MNNAAHPAQICPRLYGDLAWTWPIISPPEDYAEEAEEAISLIQASARIPVRTLLHLGCGGGHLDRTLKSAFDVTGVDASESMLSLARKLNPTVPYVQGDMRTVRLETRFDSVAVFDSIDYMRTEGDLRDAFATAWAHLRPGGVFLTYAEVAKESFDQNRTRHVTGSTEDTEIVFIENQYDPDPADTAFETTFIFLIRRDSRLDVEWDRHEMGLFSLATWTDLLEATGFEVRSVDSKEPGEGGRPVPWFVSTKPT